MSLGVLQSLNIATSAWHREADEPWLRLLDIKIDREMYRSQLIRLYGFEAPFESACASTPVLSTIVEPRDLTRAGIIAQDLLELGLSPGELVKTAQCFSVRPFSTVPVALGWLYVLQRGTLLYSRIHRHLIKRLPGIARACSYLETFEAAVDAGSWRRFGICLEKEASTTALRDEIVNAAQQAFGVMREWYQWTGNEAVRLSPRQAWASR